MTTDECEFSVDVDPTVTCVKCGRARPFPEDGKLVMREAGEPTYAIDTGVQCGDGGMGCQETRVVVRVEFGFD